MARQKSWTNILPVGDLEQEWVTRVDFGSRKLAVYDTPSGVFTSLALCNHGG